MIGWFKQLFNECFTWDENNPRWENPPMSPQQLYDHLISTKNLTKEQERLLHELHKAMGKSKWDR